MAKKPIGPLCISDSVELEPRRNLSKMGEACFRGCVSGYATELKAFSKSAVLFIVTGFLGGCCGTAALARLLYVLYSVFDGLRGGAPLVVILFVYAFVISFRLGGLAWLCIFSSGGCFLRGWRNLYGYASRGSIVWSWVFWGLSVVSLMLLILSFERYPFTSLIPH